MITKNKEDYLKAIYHLREEFGGPIKSVKLAKYLEVSKPSVSEMIKDLFKSNFVSYKKYGMLDLTKKGFEEAKRITYKHRIIEVFLIKILKLDLSMVHEEGDKLEHAFSDESVRKISLLLKGSKFCPHGKLIPDIKIKK